MTDQHTDNPMSLQFTIYAVKQDWAVDDESSHTEELYTCPGDAARAFQEFLEEEKENGCIPNWMGLKEFRHIHDENSYECWLEGEYKSNHFLISIEQKMLHPTQSIRHHGYKRIGEKNHLVIINYPHSDWGSDIAVFHLPASCTESQLMTELELSNADPESGDFTTPQDYADSVLTRAASALGGTWEYVRQSGSIDICYEGV